jgi:two-component system, response regulator PdtaR
MEPLTDQTRVIRILLVEDESLISAWVAESLAEQGFAVACAANAADALRLLASTPVDVLFTDIELPGGIDGITLARRAREFLPDLPVVYASGRVVLDVQRRVSDSTFVAKPYEPERVGALLAKAARSASAYVAA